jgi:hypothetical protein
MPDATTPGAGCIRADADHADHDTAVTPGCWTDEAALTVAQEVAARLTARAKELRADLPYNTHTVEYVDGVEDAAAMATRIAAAAAEAHRPTIAPEDGGTP